MVTAPDPTGGTHCTHPDHLSGLGEGKGRERRKEGNTPN